MKNKIQNINEHLLKNKKYEEKDTILIAGSPRSGTTWLMDILRTIPGYTNLFEPLNPIWCPESFDVGFRSRTYLSQDKQWPEGKEFLQKTFTGKIAFVPIKDKDNPMADFIEMFSIKSAIKHVTANKLIVKSVNMNRLLPWISKNFQLKSIFYIIRHPCASISSQLKTGLFGYRPSSPPYIDIPPKKEDVLNEIKEIKMFDSNLINKIQKLDATEEILAASWALDNFIPLNYSKPYPWKTIFYENLVNSGEGELNKIFNHLGQKTPSSALGLLKKPSIVTLKEDKKLVNQPDKQLSKWKSYLSDKQIERILKVVSYFDIDIYSEDIVPISKSL